MFHQEKRKKKLYITQHSSVGKNNKKNKKNLKTYQTSRELDGTTNGTRVATICTKVEAGIV